MLTISLLSIFACTADKEDTADMDSNVEVTDTDTDEEIGIARVRVVHLAPDAPGVDVFVNGAASGIDNIEFLGTTGFVELPVGEYSFAVAPAGQGFDNAVPVTLEATLEEDVDYTAIAHGYLDETESNGFAISPFVGDTSEPTQGNFRVQVIHAAAATAFSQVDVWNITDPSNPEALIPDFDYGSEVTTELPTGIAFVLGLDVNDDAEPDAIFNIPDSLTGFIGLYAVNDVDGNPSLLAHFEDGTSAELLPQ